ncbi:pentatricopeptide repeat-containing protein At2g13600-like [Selaginella moellendorffii]|uniref:pentatricopeptide repeat-containing protein At2g13600-like n=1 Tax=Selaginella moellendorffii TaxID=88036 RepID=UPI000D1CB7D5|nr:pentatricopeptide repeat-containing protein At2g13600-like [Selaginella moellendorffii]|eukprot:XP_024540898.1 pentatricopeptide repeat-containing protein At2g13600-like [Selaginella moellendorffii]
MYSRCGSVADAHRVFDAMPCRNVVAWTALMAGYLESSSSKDFDSSGSVSDRDLGSRLVKAAQIFERFPQYDVVTWNSLLLGYVENGRGDLALDLFQSMEVRGLRPNAGTFMGAIKACSAIADCEESTIVIGSGKVKLGALEKGMMVHSRATRIQGDSLDVFVENTLVDMYAKCGSLVDSRGAFDRMEFHTVVSWNALLLGYAENGEGEIALELFERVSCEKNALTFVAAVKACSGLAAREDQRQVDGRLVKVVALERGTRVHAQASSIDDPEAVLANTLVDFYSKCGSMTDARRVFDSMECQKAVAWNALMFGYCEYGDAGTVLELFNRMKTSRDCAPTSRSYVAALKACTSVAGKEVARKIDGRAVKLASLEKGMALHAGAVEKGHTADCFVTITLIDMYANCGSLVDARSVFDRMPSRSVVAWTALLMGYAESGEEGLALDLLTTMKDEGFEPDTLTFVAAAKACIGVAAKEEGRQVDGKLVKVFALDKGRTLHSQAAKLGCDTDVFLASTFVDVFARCGSMVDARRVFDAMPFHSMVSWNSMLLGYIEAREEAKAVEAFGSMRQEESFSLSSQNLVAVLKACGSSVAFRFGKAVHSDACRWGHETEALLATCFVDVYGKCGSMVDAHTTFDSLGSVDLVAWTALIAGYSRLGDTSSVFRLFHSMQDEGLGANRVTFICVLIACSHAGLVDEGRRYFQAMSSKYGVTPGVEHYHCMVDMLGRANALDEAVELLEAMPFEASAVAWKTVLGACQKWKNLRVAKMAFEALMSRGGGSDGAVFRLMGNVYAAAGMWEEKAKLEERLSSSDPSSDLRVVLSGSDLTSLT